MTDMSYEDQPMSLKSRYVISDPPCLDKDDRLVVYFNGIVDHRNNCVKYLHCKDFYNSNPFCLGHEIFSSNPKLCESLNGSISFHADICYTASSKGHALDLGEYLLYEKKLSPKLPNHHLLRINTTGYDFIAKNETMYLAYDQNLKSTTMILKPIDPRIPHLRIFKIPPVKVSINLKYTQSNHSLLLHCYNCDYVGFLYKSTTLRCYTKDDYGDSVYLELESFKKVNPRLEIFTVQKFQQYDLGYRRYKCEWMTIFDEGRLMTDTVLVGYQEPTTLSLAFFLDSSAVLKNNSDFIEQFKKDMEVNSARIIPIEQSKRILMHVSVPNTTYTVESFKKSLKKNFGDKFHGNVNSTDFCFGEPFHSSFWKTVRPGETSFLEDYRIRNKKGAPMSRRCFGDFEYGAMWEPIKEQPVIKEMDQKTQKWFGIVTEMNETNVNENVAGLTKDICNSTWKMEPTSVVVMADVFNKFKFHKKAIAKENVESLSLICSKLMEQPSETFEQSTETNKTNVLLNSIEEIFDDYFLREDAISNERGVSFTVQEQFSVFSIDPQKSDVRGMGFYTKKGKGRFQEGKIYYDYITSSQTLESFKSQNDPDLDMATYFPEDLITFLNPSKNKNFRIIFKIYNNDNLFQTTKNTTPNQDVEDKVISISVPGYSTDFPESFLPILFRIQGKHPGCYYWNYDTWVNGGIESTSTDPKFMYCQVNHLTPFTRITDVVSTVDKNSSNYKALNVITQIGLSLSLLGVLGILASTYYIPEMRFSKSSKIMLQITIALLFEIILFFISGSNSLQKNEKLCITMGSLLQYIILVKFVWMTIIAVTNWLSWYSPFKYGMRRDTNENKIEVWLVVTGWIAPVIPVFFTVIFGNETGGLDFCFPSGNGKIWGFIVPMYTMFAVILVFFVLLMLEFQKMVNNNVSGNNKKEVIQLIIGNIKLLIFSMGIPWCFGALHMLFSGGEVYGTIFSYLFCIVVPLQGFFMFLFLVALNQRVQIEVKKRVFKKKPQSKDEETTASTRLTSENVNTEQISLQEKKSKWQENPLYKKKAEVT
ncbi:hypothetical protein ACFFRR_000179 [Megaselia abdita]